TTGTSTVAWTTVAGTAGSGSDYSSASGTLTFSAGQTTKTIVITISADKKAEATETFTVVLSSPTNAVISDGSGVVTITDNDGALSAAGRGPGSTSVVSTADLEITARSALDAWVAAGASPVTFAGVVLVVADLPGSKLAETLGRTITVDVDAAGWGWSLTPGIADPSRVDLLSVLLHELGHVAGFEHDAAGIMEGQIAPGQLLAVEPMRTEPTGVGHESWSVAPTPGDTALPAVDGTRSVESAASTAPAAEIAVDAVRRSVTATARAVEGTATSIAVAARSTGGLPTATWCALVLVGGVLLALRRRRAV
ncbi:MAG: hypothetical protein MUE78_07350, partial [Ilumatobacteraceae bacterium]|nr:hypothetical protein [Ilumatobacteraceae bacterium]